MKLTIIVTDDEVDGGYIAECPEIRGAMTQGETVPECVASMGKLLEALEGLPE